jgi:uncharacterized protein (TIGR03086 family)
MDADAPDLVALDRLAVETTVELVELVTRDSLARPTPCAGWTVRDLIEHMTGQHLGFAAAASGKPTELADFVPVPVEDDPIGVYRLAAADVIAAFADEEVLARSFHLVEISEDQVFPARLAIGFHLLDYTVHAWDLARGLGAPLAVDPVLAATTLAIARQVPAGEARTRPGAAFRPTLTATPGAAALDEALRLLGRDPAWSPAE